SERRRVTCGEARQLVVGGEKVRCGLCDGRSVPLDGLPVAALDRARQLEVVVNHTAHERVERLGWHGGLREQLAGHPTESDEVVRGDHRARVVERAEIVRKREGTDPKEDGELVRDRTGLLRLAGDGRPGAVELLRATVVGERLQRVEGEAASMR